jgi:hypothetical protein
MSVAEDLYKDSFRYIRYHLWTIKRCGPELQIGNYMSAWRRWSPSPGRTAALAIMSAPSLPPHCPGACSPPCHILPRIDTLVSGPLAL